MRDTLSRDIQYFEYYGRINIEQNGHIIIIFQNFISFFFTPSAFYSGVIFCFFFYVQIIIFVVQCNGIMQIEFDS